MLYIYIQLKVRKFINKNTHHSACQIAIKWNDKKHLVYMNEHLLQPTYTEWFPPNSNYQKSCTIFSLIKIIHQIKRKKLLFITYYDYPTKSIIEYNCSSCYGISSSSYGFYHVW